MITQQDIMDAVERDPEYIQKKNENIHQIDLLEGQVFEIRERIRELHKDREKLYNDTFDRIKAEMEGNA